MTGRATSVPVSDWPSAVRSPARSSRRRVRARTRAWPLFSETIALEALRYLVFEQAPQPGYRLEQLRFDAETFDRLRARHPLFDATDPDLPPSPTKAAS